MHFQQPIFSTRGRITIILALLACIVVASIGVGVLHQRDVSAQTSTAGTLYGVGGTFDSVAQQPYLQLYTLDPATGQASTVGSGIAIGGGGGPFALDPATHRLFTFAIPPGSPSSLSDLYSIDTTTGTLIANPLLSVPNPENSQGIAQLVFDTSSHTLYGIGGTFDPVAQQPYLQLYTLDPATGQATTVGSGVPIGGGGGPFALDPATHRLFTFAVPSGGPSSLSDLYSIDTTTGTLIANPLLSVPNPENSQGIAGLLFDTSSHTLYGIGGTFDPVAQQQSLQLYTLDPATGQASTVGSGIAIGGGNNAFALDPATHRLFTFAIPPGSPSSLSDLYSIDTTTGTLIANPLLSVANPENSLGISALLFAPATATVSVTAPTTPQSATAGTSMSMSLGSFSDTGGNGPWTVDVDWGDGSTHTAFSVSTQGSLGTQTHVYATVSTYTVSITVTNAANASGSAQFPVFVTTSGASVSNVSSGTSSSTSGTASASLGSGSTTLSAGASGSGTITLAQYSANPAPTTPPSPVNAYYDIYLTPGNSFTSTQVDDCNLAGGNVVYWWNGTAWVQVSSQSYDPSSNCVMLTLTSNSSPSVFQLSGTYFGVQKTSKGANCALSSYPSSNSVYDLRNANLSTCPLANAPLARADLSDANLSLAYLGGANMSGARLVDTNLSGTGLFGANLANANLKGANLKGANSTGVTWQNTTCPDGTNSNNDNNTCAGHL